MTDAILDKLEEVKRNLLGYSSMVNPHGKGYAYAMDLVRKVDDLIIDIREKRRDCDQL